ncbi:unnamed protein product, partial [Heterotrigona itama]
MSQPNSSSSNSGNSGHPDNSGNIGNHGNSNGNNFRQPGNSARGRWIRGRKSIGRTFPPGQCICTRENSLVVCNACGFFKTGRIHHSCPVHHQMSCDLLPEWLNLFLDDVETTLCLPILIVMVLCTIQFIINHAMDIGLTVYQNIVQKSDEDEEVVEKEKGENLITKIK